MRNIINLAKEIIEELIEEHGLDYGNAYIDTNEEDITCVIEAPNHATIGIDIFSEDIKKTIIEVIDEFVISEKKKQDLDIEQELKQLIVNKMIERLEDFDADEEFELLWSVDFGKHNNFRASEFLRMLMDDEEFFQSLIEELK